MKPAHAALAKTPILPKAPQWASHHVLGQYPKMSRDPIQAAC